MESSSSISHLDSAASNSASSPIPGDPASGVSMPPSKPGRPPFVQPECLFGLNEFLFGLDERLFRLN